MRPHLWVCGGRGVGGHGETLLNIKGVLTVSHPVAGKGECLGLGEERISPPLCAVRGPGDCW